jgi:hypothetical protein
VAVLWGQAEVRPEQLMSWKFMLGSPFSSGYRKNTFTKLLMVISMWSSAVKTHQST